MVVIISANSMIVHFWVRRPFFRASHLGLLYVGSVVVLAAYSILYGLTAKEARWLGAITSAAVIILGMPQLLCLYLALLTLPFSDVLIFLGTCFVDWNIGACLYGFQLLKSGVLALFVAGMSRVFLICFGVHYWFVSTNFILFSYN